MYKPNLYTETNGPQRRDVKELTEEFVDEIGKMSGRCIDIGSGPGDVVTDFIFRKLNTDASIVYSDISESMVEFAKKKYGDNERISFVQLDIEAPKLSDQFNEQFDHATSFYCLHWCRDMRRVFENIFNLLRPGGTTLITFLASSPSFDPFKILQAMPRYQPYMKDADRYIPAFQHTERPRETIKSLVQDVGFEVLHCSFREKYYIFQNVEAFGKFTLAVNPFIGRIPAELKKQYEADLVQEVAKVCIVFNENGAQEEENARRVLLTYDTFILHLKKSATNST